VELSVLPDIDAAVSILLGDLGRYHNHMMSSPAIFGSFGRFSMASRRNRGPGAFRPRLLAGLALSLLSPEYRQSLIMCWAVNLIRPY